MFRFTVLYNFEVRNKPCRPHFCSITPKGLYRFYATTQCSNDTSVRYSINSPSRHVAGCAVTVRTVFIYAQDVHLELNKLNCFIFCLLTGPISLQLAELI